MRGEDVDILERLRDVCKGSDERQKGALPQEMPSKCKGPWEVKRPHTEAAAQGWWVG